MKSKSGFAKKDLVVVLFSVAFALANLGAIGSSSGRRRAKEFVCLSNLLRWGPIFQAFTNDNNGYFPKRGYGDFPGMVEWPVAFESYYKNPKLLLCPEATKTPDEGGRNPFMAWEYDETRLFVSSYCINNWVSNETYSLKGVVNGFWRTPHVKDASRAPILLDGQWKDADPLPTDDPPEHEGDLWTPNAQEIRRVCVNRHNGGVNGLFLDFSARKVGLKELWEIWWYQGWPEDRAAAGTPVWPPWMENFKDYNP